MKLMIKSNFPQATELNDFIKRDFGQNSDLGTVLSWNPKTGSLQLTKAATQRMLDSLGGRLTQRRDTGITIFFPTEEAQ